MKNKIDSIEINGFRGIKELLTLKLNKKSVLIYGDNGTGKSSLTDALEWFYFDNISYLSGEEIEKRGKGALRNIFLKDNEDASVKINYSTNTLSSKKSLNNVLQSQFSNVTNEFSDFIKKTHSENIILHYRDLVSFIIASKKDKLDTLQKIIGFREVGNLRDLLKKSAGRISRNLKLSNFDNQKNAKQAIILENLGQSIYKPTQLFEVANVLIKPLNLNFKITSFKDIDIVLKAIEEKQDLDLLEEINFFTKVFENFTYLLSNIENIKTDYNLYYLQFSELKKDCENIKKLQLLSFLNEGQNVLEKDVIENNLCPLCLQSKDKNDLLRELNTRVNELEELRILKNNIEKHKTDLKQLLQTNLTPIDILLNNKYLSQEKVVDLNHKIIRTRNTYNTILSELDKNILTEDELLPIDKLGINESEMKSIVEFSKNENIKLTESQSNNIKFKTYTKLDRSTEALKEYIKIGNEQDILLKQQQTFQLLFEDFIKRQEKALKDFLSLFSHDINDFYTSMNRNEQVEDIKLVPIKDKNDDLVGITIEYKFFNIKATPPHAYLSESHVNCLGLAFFLASVKAFNKLNKFFLLDDVISSFDRKHRTRFAKLLVEKFSDYQILLLTHEKTFFELTSSEIKSKNWLIYNFEWSKDKGVFLEEGLPDLKERILNKFSKKIIDGLGNDVRTYLERILKQIAFETEVKVSFRFNELNEQRMAPELLNSLQAKVSKASPDLKGRIDIQKVKSIPMFVGNRSSHDNPLQFSIEDLELMWDEISKLINNFQCSSCHNLISVKHYDSVNKKIRCNCGTLNYGWQK